MSRNSTANICPVCHAEVGLTHEVGSPIVCPECGKELVVKHKYYHLCLVIAYALGFLVAYIQKLEGLILVGAGVLYGLVIFLGLGYLVLPLLPHQPRVATSHVQGLGIEEDKRNMD
jgi:DNA-directed RNA polymerase subunit RPC12/RpoP